MAINRLQSPYNITPISLLQGAYVTSIPSNSSVYEFIAAGQTNTTAGVAYRVHEFENNNTPGNSVSYTVTFSRGGYIDVLILAGGGAGGHGYMNSDANSNYAGGGGGAGGLLIQYQVEVVANNNYTINVGSGGAPGTGLAAVQTTAGDSTAFGYTATGGGNGGTGGSGGTWKNGKNGGSGGGAVYNYTTGAGTVGTGVSGQGNSGAVGNNVGAGGGGGYSTAGSAGASTNSGGNGGNGISVNFDGMIRPLAAGGAGGNYSTNPAGVGGLVDGVVTGGNSTYTSSPWAQAAPINQTPIALGCGGGGSGSNGNGSGQFGGNGSNGIVMIRYAL